MMLFTVFIMRLGYIQGDTELLYLGFGLPFWFYLLYTYLKWVNRITVDTESLTIKNIFFGQKNIYFKEIEQWEEIQTTRIFQRNLLLKVHGKKIVISNMSDAKNYEILRHSLKTNLTEIERKYT